MNRCMMIKGSLLNSPVMYIYSQKNENTLILIFLAKKLNRGFYVSCICAMFHVSATKAISYNVLGKMWI